MEGWTCICKMLNFCNVSNQNAISKFRLQYRRIAVWLLRLQSYCWDGCLIAEIAVWFWKLVKIRGPEREASHWLRAHNQGLWLVERTRFKKFKALAFRSEISLIQFIPDGNLYNQTASFTIRLQSPQSNCNLHNQTSMKEDCSLIAEIAVWFLKWVKIGGPEIEASHWLRSQNWGLWLVERTGFKKFKSLAFRSEISVIPLISDCNIVNQTVISTIRLQSQQSE